jgi:23S rRNA pseudouridine955/2504/2580 synthase/23S rRNA pseudouridine1911/1915/1917 synthase
MSFEIHVPDHILYQDEYILVLNKPAGLMVEPDRNNYPNLLHQVRKYLQSTVGKGAEIYAQHIHRLDRPVSGVILFAIQRSVLKNLSEQFAERKVKKYYQALTETGPDKLEGIYENWIQKKKKLGVITDHQVEFSEKAILKYTVEKLSDHRFLWDIELHTGKYHQIRAQLSHAGHPVIGDALYNSRVAYKPNAIALHASTLIFAHPITNIEIKIESGIVLK